MLADDIQRLRANTASRAQNGNALHSTDEGRTWGITRHLENQLEGSFHYPTVIQGADGTIHCVYSYFLPAGQTMKHVAFTEAWISAAEPK